MDLAIPAVYSSPFRQVLVPSNPWPRRWFPGVALIDYFSLLPLPRTRVLPALMPCIV